MDLGIREFPSKGRHFTFNAAFDDRCKAGLAFKQVMQIRPFISTRILPMTVCAITIKKLVTALRLACGRNRLTQ